MNNCLKCGKSLNKYPNLNCEEQLSHWKSYALHIDEKLDQKDDVRDKLDVAEWLETYPKTKSYNCHACKRHYEYPIYLTHIVCVCGQRCRLQHLGGINPDLAVIEAAMNYFGNERMAQLAWIAEIVGGEHCLNYSADKIREMIQDEINRWESTDTGWIKKGI